jgi:hypothetical protein
VPRQAATALRNDELDRAVAFDLCQDPRETWVQLWPGLEHLD